MRKPRYSPHHSQDSSEEALAIPPDEPNFAAFSRRYRRMISPRGPEKHRTNDAFRESANCSLRSVEPHLQQEESMHKGYAGFGAATVTVAALVRSLAPL